LYYLAIGKSTCDITKKYNSLQMRPPSAVRSLRCRIGAPLVLLRAQRSHCDGSASRSDLW